MFIKYQQGFTWIDFSYRSSYVPEMKLGPMILHFCSVNRFKSDSSGRGEAQLTCELGEVHFSKLPPK